MEGLSWGAWLSMDVAIVLRYIYGTGHDHQVTAQLSQPFFTGTQLTL